jgi:hypothetical protein
MGLSFTVAADPRQRSHSQVRVPRNSWPHFIVSHPRLPQCEGQVPVFISLRNRWPGYTPWFWVLVLCYGQSVSLSWNKSPIRGLRSDFYYCQTLAGLLAWSALSDERTGLSVTIAAGPRQRTLRSHSVDLATKFYCLRFKTFLFVSYDSQGHGGGIGPRLLAGWLYTQALGFLFAASYEPYRKHHFQQFYCCVRIHCCGNVFTLSLPSNGCILLFHYSAFQPSCLNMFII